jgi:GNAT superfamily N-acetyltransferase
VAALSAPRPIRDTDLLTEFDSSEDSLNQYLRKRALFNHVEGGSRCFVVCRDERVVGYYALAAATVTRAEAPRRVERNMPETIPAVLLSRLGVDCKEQGRGLGAALLRDAILRTVTFAEQIGVRILLVHAPNDEARTFYEHFNFEPSLSDPLHLFLLLKDIRAMLDKT